MRKHSRWAIPVVLSILMLTSTTSASISNWNGPSVLDSNSSLLDDAFEVPGNSTVIDAWLHVDESGYENDGTGLIWNEDGAGANFTNGQFSNTLVGKFDGAMSLAPDSSVSNVDTFSSTNLQLPSGWSEFGGVWKPVSPTSMNGTVSGQNRVLPHGVVPASAYNGAIIAATLPGQGLPSNSYGSMISPQYSIPSPIQNFNLTFAHWHHLDINDGAWIEYRLDSGSWSQISPVGGYPHSISNSSAISNPVNPNGSLVFGDGNHSGWVTTNINLDNISGISNASNLQFRFLVWTDSSSTSRPGWFIDDIYLTNQGNSIGYWHHGCISQTSSSCYYSSSAYGAIESDINLSATATGSKIKTRLHFDLEGSYYDNFCVELSTNNGTNWTDISSGSSSTIQTCSDRSSPIPGSSYTLPNGTTVYDDSGGFVELDFSIPASMLGNNQTSKIRYLVETDYSFNYGSPADTIEGLTVDWFKVINSNGTTIDENQFSGPNSATSYGVGGATNDWSYIQIGSGGYSANDSFESSTSNSSFPAGWTTITQSGQTGWEFGSLCNSYSDGPSSFTSANVGFGTDLCGDYDSSADNSLITPDYFVPLGASASFVWKHWMCAEDNYDGGELFISTNSGPWSKVYVNYTNGSNWYDGQTYGGTDVWDGRQYLGFSSCSSSTVTIPWMDMSYDVSNLSGNNLSFRFRHTSDSSVQEAGWYVDDVGLEVDWFETEGSWRTPLISAHDLGYGFVDADIYLPTDTWYGVNVLDSSGSVIPGHQNLTLPLSLSSINREIYSSVYIEFLLGTEDKYYSPLVKEISIGSTRYFGENNGWNIPSSVSRLSNGSWENVGTSSVIINGETGYSSRPISSLNITGVFTQTTVSVVTSMMHSVSTSTPNSILDLGKMSSQIAPRVTMPPGSVIESLAYRGNFVQPTTDAVVDLANDGVIDWSFSSSPNFGALGWQSMFYSTSYTNSLIASGNTSTSLLIPEQAVVDSILLGITPEGPVDSLMMTSGSNNLYQFNYPNWTTSVISMSNPNLHSKGTITDNHGRNWSTIDLSFVTSAESNFSVGSVAVSYNLFENVSGLGQVVKSYHDANSNNGQLSIVDVPIAWETSAGGISVDGGVYHENLITNHPFSVPDTWYPNGILQGFSTQHHHLIDNDLINEIHLIGQDSSGSEVKIIVDKSSNEGEFQQVSGGEILQLSNTSSITEVGGRIIVDWQFDVGWSWDDSQSIIWYSQAFDSNGEGLSPASAQSGSSAIQASENDLEIDSWQIIDMSGHELSDEFSASYPFYAKSGTAVSISGTVKFQNTVDVRPQFDDFVVGVSLDGYQVAFNSTGDGTWAGLVTLPSSGLETTIEPFIVRVGPITGATGAQDETSINPITVKLDSISPYAKDLLVDTGQKLKPADGFTWEPSAPLNMQVTIIDEEALGDQVSMYYWREGIDDVNLDGIADVSEYQKISKPLPEGQSGERTVSFGGIDVSQMSFNSQFSVFFESKDYAGHDLTYAGYSGIDNDMATLIIAVNEPTTIPIAGISLDTHSEQLLAGQNHKLTMNISDANGVNSIDVVEIHLAGLEDDGLGLMVWEPRNGAFYTGENSQIILHNVSNSFTGENQWQVEWEFSIDWEFDISRLQEYSLPSIIVYDDDELNPVVVLSNIGKIRWQLDNNLQVVLENTTDTTPPISQPSSEHIFVQPGDDLKFSGHISYQKSGAKLVKTPPQGLEVEISTVYGSEVINSYAEVMQNGEWESGIILPTRSILESVLSVDYSLTGVVSPGQDVTTVQSLITVDEVAPLVQFSYVPLVIDNEELSTLQFSLLVTDEGGMPGGGLLVNWAFMRNGVNLANGQSNGVIPLISSNGESYSYAGNIDFTSGINLTFEQGDELIWWIDVVDMAGNQAIGTGLSMIDAMRTDFTILSFDVSVTNIEISLANGKAPKGNEVVEGTEIGVVVHVRNLGTKIGTVNVSLMEDVGEGRTWINHGSFELVLSPARTQNTQPLLFETYGSGSQGLYANITGHDAWVINSLMPNCFENQETVSCDLSAESDMPRVISQDDFESGISFMTITISILVILLLVAGFAIVILARKDNDIESIFDDDWDDDIDDDEKDTPNLPSYTSTPGVDYGKIDYSVLDKNQSETAPSTEHTLSEEE